MKSIIYFLKDEFILFNKCMFDSLIVFFVLSVNFDEDCYFYENQ